MNWFERQYERLRSLNPLLTDGIIAVVASAIGVATVFSQELADGMVEPTAVAVATAIVVSGPIAIRRRSPLLAITISTVALLIHIAADFPEGSLPASLLFLTYTVAAWSSVRNAMLGLGAVYLTLVALGATDTPGLDALGIIGNIAVFTVGWAIGLAMRAHRDSLEARVHAAEERANFERQRTATLLAEERLRIAQELHDVVAHSMSVIAVQAGVGAHVLACDRPDEARVALEAISATSRGTLTEMRRLLGVLRGTDGARSHLPAPCLADLPQLVDDVRAVGVPVTLEVHGSSEFQNPTVELSAYRVVQEALTNVIKHAGRTTRVAVAVRFTPGSLAVDVVDDGRGAASHDADRAGKAVTEYSGHGHLGMRERVELWGGHLIVGPLAGGGYQVRATLPYGDCE